jgi:hypothetical protein
MQSQPAGENAWIGRGSVHMDEKEIVNLGKIFCPDE